MSHRDDCLVSTIEEAKRWLEMYRHTLTFDPQALRVIEMLEAEIDNTSELDAANDRIDQLDIEIEELEDLVKYLKEDIAKLSQA
jgi:peptidoglycan hydrolase CwlO-like protein